MNESLLWRLAIYKLINGAFLVAAVAYIGATASVNWVDMHANERVIIGLTVLIAVGKFVDGFFDTTVPKLLAGKSPFPGGNGNTAHITKEQTKQNDESTPPLPPAGAGGH